MEEFLGRPLRTLEQLRAMRNVDSEEIKAVKRKEVGPACFARESDPPVSFTPLEVPKCETNKVPAEIGVEITERGSVPAGFSQDSIAVSVENVDKSGQTGCDNQARLVRRGRRRNVPRMERGWWLHRGAV